MEGSLLYLIRDMASGVSPQVFRVFAPLLIGDHTLLLGKWVDDVHGHIKHFFRRKWRQVGIRISKASFHQIDETWFCFDGMI